MTSRQSRTVDGPVGPIAVDVFGEPTADGTVVLVHPINTAALVWDPVAELLDRPVVALDLRGHGRSPMTGPFAIEGGWLDDVVAVLDGLGLNSAHLAGGSLGGTISLAAAALHPERVRSVACFGSTLGVGVPTEAIEAMVTELETKGTVRYFADLGPQVVGAASRDDRFVLASLAAAVGARDTAVIAGILRGAFSADIRHLGLSGIKVPVLAATGTEDPTCPPEMTAEIASVTGGTAVELPGLGHLPMLEQPQRVVELLLQNITQSEAAA
ncbi:alpha/beta fold hydrolase [Sporichthya brevicatena]|uniref:alpha/beta fold hydrolase n=1 Tax=Sporichthya brevicatena TaxID=171442 RepID=UPI0031D4992C